MAALIDGCGRRLSYVRISVTDRCNFRCSYCMPAEGVPVMRHDEILRYEDISFLCRCFCRLGVGKFRFTGGEPLVRKELPQFLLRLKDDLPDIKLALTTNAALLDRYAGELAQLELDSLNISIDTLDPEKFAKITRIGRLETVIKGIHAAVDAGVKNIKLNAVMIRGFNDGEVGELLEFAKKERVLLRLIEFMPLEDGVWNEDSFIGGGEMLKMLPDPEAWRAEQGGVPEDGPARYYVNGKTGDRLGIIEAVSNHFCSGCNRLRVSAAGALRLCLFDDREIELRELIRARDQDALCDKIIGGVREKPRCWSDVRSGMRRMSKIGG